LLSYYQQAVMLNILFYAMWFSVQDIFMKF